MGNCGYLRDISESVFVVGMALTLMSYNTTQEVVDIELNLKSCYSCYQSYSSNNSLLVGDVCNIYLESNKSLKDEAESLFGIMRMATDEELAGVNNYIRSISVETGVSFFSHAR